MNIDEIFVMDTLNQILLKKGVKLEIDGNILGWHLNQENEIESITFEKKDISHNFELKCCMLICFEEKIVSEKNFRSEFKDLNLNSENPKIFT